jgi:hypothetical protein
METPVFLSLPLTSQRIAVAIALFQDDFFIGYKTFERALVLHVIFKKNLTRVLLFICKTKQEVAVGDKATAGEEAKETKK